MARKKKRDDEEDIELEAEAEEPEAVVEDDADEEIVEEEEHALDDEPVADDDDRDDDRHRADDDEADRVTVPPDEEEEEADVERPPRARTPVLAIVLLLLNFLALPPFVVLLVADYAARQQWSYATFVNRVLAYGLPLKEEENQASLAYQTRPRLRLESDKLKEAYSSPQRKRRPGTPSFSDPFQPADTLDEPYSFRISPAQIDDQVKQDLFGKNGLGDPVGTIDDEVARLKRTVPPAIQDAAAKYAADQKTAEKKLAALEKILLPLSLTTVVQVPDAEGKEKVPRLLVEVLQERIDKAKGNDAELDKLLQEAVERRMLIDVLAPVNIYQPGNIDKYQIEKVGDLDTYKLDELRDILVKRFDDAIAPTHIGEVYGGQAYDGKQSESIHKRHSVAFLMVALARLKAPDAKEPLFPKGMERAQVVNGLYEFTIAAANYPRALKVLENRVVAALKADREGHVVGTGKDATVTQTGFVDQLGNDIEKLKKVKEDIVFVEKRIKELAKQRDHYMDQYNDRVKLLADVAKKLIEAKGETKKLREDLQEKNSEMLEAQKYLGVAAEQNERLEAEIRAAERELLPKGGKKKR